MPAEVGTLTRLDNSAFSLHLPEFAPLEDAAEVKKAAETFLVRAAGACYASGTRPRDLQVAHVWKENDDGTKTVFVLIEECINLSDEVEILAIDQSGKELYISPSHNISALLKLSQVDAAVRKVLELLTRGADWVNLYRIYEAIQADAGTQLEKWSSSNKLRTFKHTANSAEVLGHDARHGKSVGAPPANPMSHQEAQALIESLVANWLASKSTT